MFVNLTIRIKYLGLIVIKSVHYKALMLLQYGMLQKLKKIFELHTSEYLTIIYNSTLLEILLFQFLMIFT